MRFIALFFILSIFIYSCATTSIDSYCVLYEPIYYNVVDIKDEEVLDVIRLNNGIYVDKCSDYKLMEAGLENEDRG